MIEQLRLFSAARRRLVSILLLLGALGAALLLAACAGTSNASSASGGLNAQLSGGAAAGSQELVLASMITPAAPAPVAYASGSNAGGSNAAAAPALFGGRITQMTDNGGDSVWQVAGHAVHVTSSTVINDAVARPAVGAHVTVGGTPRSDGGADAAWVRVDDAGSGASAVMPDQSPAPDTGALNGTTSTGATTQAPSTATNGTSDTPKRVVYCGYLDQLPQKGIVGDWRVSERTVRVGDRTLVRAEENNFDLGRFVFVRGALQGDGSINAEQMWVRPAGNNRCLPGLRIGQNDGAGNGNGNGRGNGNGEGNGNSNGNGQGNGNGNGHGNGNGRGNGKGNGK